MTVPITRSRRHVALGSALQAVVRLLILASGAIAVAIQARTLTISEYGVFVTILTVLALLSSLTDIGLTNTAVQLMARSAESQGAIAGALLIARGVLGLLLGAVGAVISLFLFSTSTDRVAAMLVIAALPVGMLVALQAIPIAQLQLGRQNLLIATQGLLWLLVVILLGWVHADLIVFAAGYLLCALVQGSLVWLLLGRRSRLDLRSGRRVVPRLLRQAIPLGVGGMGVTAYYRLSGIILFATAGSVAAASYAAAFKVVDILQALPASLLAPLIPLLARALEFGDRSRVIRLWDLASRLIVSTSTMAAAGVVVAAPQIVQVLFGPNYADSVPLLRVVALAFIPICLGWLTTAALTATGEVRGYAVVTLCAAALSVGCALLLMPRLGAAAAAGITLGTEIVVAAGLLTVLYRQTRLGIRLSVWLRTLTAAGLMGAAVWLVEPAVADWILLCIRVPIGIAVGVFTLVLLNVLSISDVRMVLSRADIKVQSE